MSIDIARGVAIILVVIGHSGINSYFWNLIYFFHMPLFFFISGCFFRPLQNFHLLTYIRKLRWNELYKNFVLYSILFLIISPLLCHYGISNSNITSWGNFWSRIIIILRFRTPTVDLLGQFWFLPVLFFVHAISLLFIKERNKYIFIFALGTYFIGKYCNNNGINEPYDFSRILYYLGFYLFGFILYPHRNLYVKNKKFIALFCIVLLLLFSTIPKDVFASEIYYLIVAFCGIFLTLIVSNILSTNRISDMFCYIGKHTLDIFIFHTLVMKILEKCISNFGFMQSTLGWHGVMPENKLWWLFSIFGILMPLIVAFIYKRCMIYILNIKR